MGTDTGGRGRTDSRARRDAQWDFKKASTLRRAPSVLRLPPSFAIAAATLVSGSGGAAVEGEEGVGERTDACCM